MMTAVTVRISFIEASTPFARRNYQLLIVLFDTLIYALVPLAPIHRIAVGVIIAIFGVVAGCHLGYFLFAPPSWLPTPSREALSDEQSQRRYWFSWIGDLVLNRPLAMVLAPGLLTFGGISLAVRWGEGLYWALFGLVTTMGYALIYLWLVMLAHRASRQVRQEAYGS
jgi:hypothetical protein